MSSTLQLNPSSSGDSIPSLSPSLHSITPPGFAKPGTTSDVASAPGEASFIRPKEFGSGGACSPSLCLRSTRI